MEDAEGGCRQVPATVISGRLRRIPSPFSSLPVLSGTGAVFVLEALVEVGRGAESDLVGDFGDGEVGGFDEVSAAFHP